MTKILDILVEEYRQLVIRRFWEKVEKTNYCWNWKGSKTRNGYGAIHSFVNAMAHRFSYELVKEEIPKGMEVHHICKNPSCVNPSHLKIVTVLEHRRLDDVSRVRRNKTHCPKGHPLSGNNLYTYPDKRRACRTCVRNCAIKSKGKKK